MKKIIALVILLLMTATIVFAEGERQRVPRVSYIRPNNDSTIDLTGKKGLTFEWKPTPSPGGGRAAFRFTLCKGFGYNIIVRELLAPGVFSIEIPTEKFEDGALYSWYVEQRDARNMSWGLFYTWSFNVIKKK